jgi:hypothetical protein
MAAGATYTPIYTTTLGSAQASITFNSIPSTYTDLVIVACIASSNTAAIFGEGFTINNDTLSIGKLSFTSMYGTGSAAGGFRWVTTTPSMKVVPGGSGATSMNQGGVDIIQINNYSNTTTYKTILTKVGYGASGGAVYAYATLWQDLSAISKLVFYPNDFTNTMLTGTTITIYGIKAA